MRDWSKTKGNRRSETTEFDISKIDQAVFDDPILLLEYLEELEAREEKKDIPKAPTYTNKHSKTNSFKQHNYVPYYDGENSGILYGYDKYRGKIKINPEEAAAIIAITSLYDSGLNYSQIADKIYYTRYRTITGKKFYPRAVQDIIEKRKVYEGDTGYPQILKKNTRMESGNEERQYRSQASVENDSTYKEKHIIPTGGQCCSLDKIETEQNKKRVDTNQGSDFEYNNIDDFILYIMSKGVPTKDNRWNDGCVWVRADPQIEMIMKKVHIKGRQFKYASKCRAFSGEPGWYY